MFTSLLLASALAHAAVDIHDQANWCANEGATCAFTGTKVVSYGAGTRWVTKAFASGTPCSNAAFGNDPWVGKVKACFVPKDAVAATPPPPAVTPLTYKIGYTASHAAAAKDLASVEGWLGRPLDMSAMTISMSGWWPGGIPPRYGIDVSFPMLTISGWDSLNATDLGRAAAGDYDAYYTNMAKTLARADNATVVRIGWEMNGNWYPWSIGNPQGLNNTAANYVATFRRIAKILRANVPNVQIEFNTNFQWQPYAYANGSNAGTPLDYWPGADYVAVVSMDLYQSNIGDWRTIQSAGQYNLDWLVSFAKANGKKVALPEWGAARNDATFVSSAIAWMNSLGPLFAFSVYSSWAPADQFVKAGDNAAEQAVWIKAWGQTKYQP